MAQADSKSITPFLDCPTFSLIHDINGVSDAHCELDVEFANAPAITEAMNDLWMARDTLKRTMALTRATSLQGALGQVALLYELIEDIVDAIPDETVQSAVHGKEVAARRLAFSVADVLRRAIEPDERKPACVFVAQLMPPSQDPLLLVDRARRGDFVSDLFPLAKRRSHHAGGADAAA